MVELDMDKLLNDRLDTQRNLFCRVGHYAVWFYNSFPQPFAERDYVSSGYVHAHTGFDVHCPVEGSYYLMAGQKRVLLRPGQLAIVAPECYHNTEPALEDSTKCISFNFSFLERLLEKHALFHEENDDEQVISAYSGIPDFIVMEDDGTFRELIQKIRFFLSEHGMASYQVVQGFLTALIVLMSRKIPRTPVAKRSGESLTIFRKEIIEEFFDNSVGTDILPEVLAEKLHVSVRQLNRIMIEIFGMGFKQKRMHVRVEIAKNWLCHTNKNLSEIAEICGYGFESSLTHAFKKATGMTPYEYRLRKRTLLTK